MHFYSLRYSALSRYYLPCHIDTSSQITLLRHIFKVSSFTLATKILYYVYIFCILLKHTLFANPFLKLSSISNPIFNNITNEFPWCVYTNSHDKYTVLILEEFYIKTIHVSNHSLENIQLLPSRLRDCNIDVEDFLPKYMKPNPCLLEHQNIAVFRNKIPSSNQPHSMSDTHIDILGHLIDKHNYVDIISLLDMYIARLNELNLTNFGIYVNHLNSLRQRYTSLKVKSVAIHGDFTPWNMYITFDNKLIVFDWEFFSYPSFPFFDLSYYFISSSKFLNRRYAPFCENSWFTKLNSYYKYPEPQFLFLVDLAKCLASVELELRSFSKSLILLV